MRRLLHRVAYSRDQHELSLKHCSSTLKGVFVLLQVVIVLDSPVKVPQESEAGGGNGSEVLRELRKCGSHVFKSVKPRVIDPCNSFMTLHGKTNVGTVQVGINGFRMPPKWC